LSTQHLFKDSFCIYKTARNLRKRAYMTAIGPHRSAKEPYISPKKNLCICHKYAQRALYFLYISTRNKTRFLRKGPTICLRKGHVNPQKRPINLQKRPMRLPEICIQSPLSTREPSLSAKEPCIFAKEPCFSAKEPYISTKEPFMSTREASMSAE